MMPPLIGPAKVMDAGALARMPHGRKLAGLVFSIILLAAFFPIQAGAASQNDEVRILVPEIPANHPPKEGKSSGPAGEAASTRSTAGKEITVVGAAESISKYVIEIANGKAAVKPVFHDKYFHARLPLNMGTNKIDFRWREAGGAWNMKSVIIFRYSRFGEDEGSYPAYIFHKAEKEKQCQQCHRMKVTKTEAQSGMDKECLKCHSGLTENVFVHGPVSVGFCTVCHNPDSTPGRYKVEKRDNVLCYSCHEDRKNTDESKKFLHGPVAGGMCTVCHDPHNSPYQYQLVRPRNEICLMCHQDDAERWIKSSNSVHPPFKTGNCPGCHDPHSSNFSANLKADKKDLCKLCHVIPVPRHQHEVGVRPHFELPKDLPLASDGKIMCMTCHDPHGAAGNRLTRRQGCNSCHERTRSF